MFGFGRKNSYSQANQLRLQGAPALGTYEYHGKTNPQFTINRDKSKYELIWSQYDLMQCTSRYVWEDLPDNIKSYDIERMLYYRTSLVGFKLSGKIFILPYLISGTLNPYGYPTKVRPITYNGKPVGNKSQLLNGQLVLYPNISGVSDGHYDSVLLFDNVPRYTGSNIGISRFALNQILIADMAEVLSRINVNLVVTNKKLFMIAKDPNQRAIIEKEITTSFGSDSPIVVISSPLEMQSVQNTDDYQADDLFNVLKNYDAIRCFMSGIQSKNFGTEKKERLVAGELAGNEEQIDLVADLGLELRQEFADKMNKLFNLNIKVHKRADEYDAETDGRGLTTDQEQANLGGKQ